MKSAAMRVVPERGPALQIRTVFAGFLLGPLGGLRPAMLLAPGMATWALAGLAYGWSPWWAAHVGYLPFPEPE